MIVHKKPQDLEAVQWTGQSHPRLEECSCHPGKKSLLADDGVVWLKHGDWIITDPKTRDIWVVSDKKFQAAYEVVATS